RSRLLLFLTVAAPTDAELVAACSNNLAVLAVNFHVLTVKRPIPRCLQDGLRLRISEDYCRFIINAWIHLLLELLGDGSNRDGDCSLHQPRAKVSAVTAEIEQRSRTIACRIGQP